MALNGSNYVWHAEDLCIKRQRQAKGVLALYFPQTEERRIKFLSRRVCRLAPQNHLRRMECLGFWYTLPISIFQHLRIGIRDIRVPGPWKTTSVLQNNDNRPCIDIRKLAFIAPYRIIAAYNSLNSINVKHCPKICVSEWNNHENTKAKKHEMYLFFVFSLFRAFVVNLCVPRSPCETQGEAGGFAWGDYDTTKKIK